MSDSICIALDAMGGDFGPRVIIPASVDALKRHPQLTLKLVGQKSVLSPVLEKSLGKHPAAAIADRITIVNADNIIANDEKPSYALRKRGDSSMFRAISLVAEGQAQACVSAGNTGALMALGRFSLKMLPGIDRPAIITAIPSAQGVSYMLDLGANVDCSAEHLLQFAVMGSVMTRAVEGIEQPRIGLLNVGEEENKGNEQVKLASRLIREHGGLNYQGFVEGDDIFTGKVDVVVCDGFVGNIALKSSEGVARLIGSQMRSSFSASLLRRFTAWLAAPILGEIRSHIDPARRNGASLLGLQGIVVKSHGAANSTCFGFAIDQAVAEVSMDLPGSINRELESQIN
ncbi:phosphate acyltransferase PlsX [Amphritea balenae]|uniref:Phosphate acyltransferase n=1 Tax=Amphritea balenae TaxID=452629 RepID=A0A3P1SL48_9GAMM|nr:phosphate acyltransferase PlsX [Amphritea balenae]RRC97981.1 phosphate acyltransferase PlsX [Amphritea balenae]GGK82266.1 phosphate acyltransferase [Amphritea balenae]